MGRDSPYIVYREFVQRNAVWNGGGENRGEGKGVFPGDHVSLDVAGNRSRGLPLRMAVDGSGVNGDFREASMRLCRGKAVFFAASRVRVVHAVGLHDSGVSGIARRCAAWDGGNPFVQKGTEKMEAAVGLAPFPGSPLVQAIRFMGGVRAGIIGEKKGGHPLPELRIPDIGLPNDPEIHTPREPEITSPRDPEIVSPREPESEPKRRDPERRQ